MAQNHGSRVRPWAVASLRSGPWAPLVAVAAVLATVTLVANGPRIGGDSPPVPDGRPYATADSTPAGTLDRTEPNDPVREPPLADPEPAPEPRSTPQPRRRAPAASHRQRRSAPARPRTRAPRGRRAVPAMRPTRPPEPSATWRAEPLVRRTLAPHRTPTSSAEREFGL